LINNFTIGGL